MNAKTDIDFNEPNPLRLGQQMCFPLYALGRVVVQMYTPMLKDIGLTYPQYIVMMVLWEEDGASVQRIGERLFLDSGTLSPLLRKLEAMGFIERNHADDDERRVINSLTVKGRELETKAAPIPFQLFCKSGLSVPQGQQLREVLWTLLNFISTHSNPSQENPSHASHQELDQILNIMRLATDSGSVGLKS